MRADFWGECASYAKLKEAMLAHQELIGPMDTVELRRGMEEQARKVGLRFEADLSNTILDDVQGEPGAMPLLQHALLELWKRRHGRWLRAEEYRAIGSDQAGAKASGIRGAIARTADDVYMQLSKAEQDQVHDIFVRLTRLDETAIQGVEQRDTRRRARLEDLVPDGEAIQREEATKRLVSQLADARLVVTSRNAVTGSDEVEVAHEALIRYWPRLRAWLDEDRVALRLREGIGEAAADWHNTPKDKDLLIHKGARLEEIEKLLVQGRLTLNERERHYITACKAHRQAQERVRKGVIAGLATLAIIAIIAAFWGWAKRNEALAQKTEAEVQTKIAKLKLHAGDVSGPPQRNLLLVVHAALIRADEHLNQLSSIDALRQQFRVTGGAPLVGHNRATRVAAFSNDRRWLATGSDDGMIRVWDLQSVHPPSRPTVIQRHSDVVSGGRRDVVSGLAFTIDGRFLVSSGEDGSVKHWPIAEPTVEQVSKFDLHAKYGAIYSMAISPDGQWLAFGTENGHVCNWKVVAGGLAKAPCNVGISPKPVTTVLFSPKGRWLATSYSGAQQNKVHLWDLSNDFPRKEPEQLFSKGELSENSLQSIAFNADETRLAVAYGHVAQVWDLTREDPPANVILNGSHDNWVMSVALSPDNRWLVTGSTGSKITLWDLTGTRQVPIELQGHSGRVNAVAFSDDGRWLAAASDDGVANVWDMRDPTLQRTLLRGHDLPLERVAFSPGDGQPYLVTLGDDPHARLWTVPEVAPDPIVLRGHQGLVWEVAVSAHGGWIASVAQDNTVNLWSLKDLRKPVRTWRTLPEADRNSAIELALSDDGHWLAAGSGTTVHVWNLHAPSNEPQKLQLRQPISEKALRFSPDSRSLVTGGSEDDAIVQFWDVPVESPGKIALRYPPCRQPGRVRHMAFSSDSRFVVTSAHDSEASLWDLKSAEPCKSRRPLGGHNVAYRVALSRDSGWVATTSFDGNGRLWKMAPSGEVTFVQSFQVSTLPAADPRAPRAATVAFSPDNRWFAFGAWSGAAKVIDLHTPNSFKVVDLVGHRGAIRSTSFSPDGDWLATGSDDNTVRLWDTKDWKAAPLVLRGHVGPVQHYGFADNGRWIVTGGNDGAVRLWRMKLDDLIDTACKSAGRELTQDERREFLGDANASEGCEQVLRSHQNPQKDKP
jgi:WD40 repeat protein